MFARYGLKQIEIDVVISEIRLYGVTMDVFPNCGVSFVVSNDAIYKRFLPDAMTDFLGDCTFELFYDARNCGIVRFNHFNFRSL